MYKYSIPLPTSPSKFENRLLEKFTIDIPGHSSREYTLTRWSNLFSNTMYESMGEEYNLLTIIGSICFTCNATMTFETIIKINSLERYLVN